MTSSSANSLNSGHEIIKLFFMFNSTEHKIIHAHNVKMQTIVCILIFISLINATFESLKARKSLYLLAF